MELREASAKYLVSKGPACPLGYKQTEMGVIPEDWDIEFVKNAFEIHNNFRLPLSEKVRKEMQGPYPYYGPTKIQDYINEYRVEGEFCLIGEDGDHFLKWQNMPMTFLVRGRFNVNNHAHIVRGVKNETIWFHYYFNNRDITKYLTRQGAGRYKLTKASLEHIPLVLPPTKTEQTAIANALNDADALIQSLNRLIVKKRQIKQGAMQTLLNPYENDHLKEGWVVKKLGDVVEKFVGGGTPSRSIKKYWGNGIPWVTVKDFSTFNPYSAQESITNVGLKNSSTNLIPQGTIVTSTRMALGKAIIYEVDVCINQDLKAIFPLKDIHVKYLLYWFEFNAEIISELGSGSTVMGLSLDDLKKIEFPKPQKTEQTRIATILSDMDAEIATLETKLTKYQKIKQGMMQNLLTGRIRLL